MILQKPATSWQQLAKQYPTVGLHLCLITSAIIFMYGYWGPSLQLLLKTFGCPLLIGRLWRIY